MPAMYFLVFVITTVAFWLALHYWNFHRKQECVRQAERLKSARNITVSLNLRGGDWSNYGYHVEYEDPQGHLHHTACKVHVWSRDVYWQDGA
jgi:hypothetical protein